MPARDWQWRLRLCQARKAQEVWCALCHQDHPQEQPQGCERVPRAQQERAASPGGDSTPTHHASLRAYGRCNDANYSQLEDKSIIEYLSHSSILKSG